MCFYVQQVWSCGYWRWDGFKEQCNRERRIGETCGLRLVFETKKVSQPCTICDAIFKKQRRIDKMNSDLRRWSRDGNKPFSVEKTKSERQEAMDKILSLSRQHSLDMNTLSTATRKARRTRQRRHRGGSLPPPIGSRGSGSANDQWAATAILPPDPNAPDASQEPWGSQPHVQTPSPPCTGDAADGMPLTHTTRHRHHIRDHPCHSYNGAETLYYDGEVQAPAYSVYAAGSQAQLPSPEAEGQVQRPEGYYYQEGSYEAYESVPPPQEAYNSGYTSEGAYHQQPEYQAVHQYPYPQAQYSSGGAGHHYYQQQYGYHSEEYQGYAQAQDKQIGGGY